MQNETLLEKIKTLRPERMAEVEDFVDFLRQRDKPLRTDRDQAVAAYAAQHGGEDGVVLMPTLKPRRLNIYARRRSEAG